ncbi:hypothetical protein M422DRAFT_259112 [Sphaerobolus stellatus SS14]|uniref:Myb-like domain-containing protein n=1 Tax=Sphaerobolus stellatus (strain SS14) TaxID=990650 RepID=A0A0C9U5D7_SPHS4|nr:hypothetical protein M422DRAFT_259112 [Sphaerobolus stellatus SS14]
MPTTRSQARQTTLHLPQNSPSWDCEDGSLPEEDSSQQSLRSASPQQSESSPPSERDQNLESDDGNTSKHMKNARTTRRNAQMAWNKLAEEMEKDSREKGTVIKWSGPACHTRFKRILAAHQKETKSLQKTGVNEEIDAHIQTLTDLVSLIDAHNLVKEKASTGAKTKASKEQAAALELKDAAMNGIRPRNTLMDISQLDGATAHEKQGQQNVSPSASKCPHHQSTLDRVLQKREEEDTHRLQEAQARDDLRHGQLISGFDRLAHGMATLNETMQTQMRQESERNAQQTEMLRLFSTIIQQRKD